MDIISTVFGTVLLIDYDLHPDERGFWTDTYRHSAFEALGVDVALAQVSLSHSVRTGTIRGLHYQVPPREQWKLVTVTKGRIFDVVVDVRKGSRSFGDHVVYVLEAATPQGLLIPPGFAHGYCTLTDDTDVLYMMSDEYSPSHYRGVRWDDPRLGIDWPIGDGDAVISRRDRAHPTLAEAFPKGQR